MGATGSDEYGDSLTWNTTAVTGGAVACPFMGKKPSPECGVWRCIHSRNSDCGCKEYEGRWVKLQHTGKEKMKSEGTRKETGATRGGRPAAVRPAWTKKEQDSRESKKHL